MHSASVRRAVQSPARFVFVLIQAYETGFFARTNAYLDVGTNIARANRLASFYFSGQFVYRGPAVGLLPIRRLLQAASGVGRRGWRYDGAADQL